MPTKLFERPADIGAPSLSGDKRTLPAPPTVQPTRFRTYLSVILPVGLVVGIIGTIVMLFLVGARTFTGVGLIFPLMMMMSFGGMMASRFGGGAGKKTRTEQEGERTDYGKSLDEFRNAADAVGERQFERVLFFNPNPLDLVPIVAGGAARMWCHRPLSYQFGKCRVGLGLSQSALELKTPKLPDRTKRDPMPNAMLRDFFLEKPYVRDIPMPLALRSDPGFAFFGDMPTIHGLVRAMLCHLATFHGPDDIGIAVVTATPSKWEWLKWMPHSCDPDTHDGAGPARLVFTSAKDFDRVFDLNNNRGAFVPVKEPEGGQHVAIKPSTMRHLIVVDDDTGAIEDWQELTRARSGVEATTFLRLAARKSDGCGWTPETTFQVTSDGRICDIAVGEPFYYAHADYMSIEEADEFARAMATWDVTKSASSVTEVMQQEGGLLEELRIADARYLEPHRIHAARKSPDSKLRGTFPLGRFKDGSTFVMNVNSTSAIPRGMGNHGLLLGATGSGKSWTLLTFIISQAATHSAEVLQHVVLDWKGRSFGRRVADLPGTLMVLSNLGKDSEYVERLEDVLTGELDRRQEILDRVAEETGRPELAEVEDYERARIEEGHDDWEPLPWIQIVVDEFTELFEMYAQIVPVFVRIGRLGRSLRVNMLLASQRMEESKLRGMEAHFGWRIALRAFSDAESRSFIGDVRAAKIPEDGGGGRGFLKIGEGEPQEIQVYDVGSLYRPARQEVQAEVAQQTENYFEPQLFSLDAVPMPKRKLAVIEPADAAPEVDDEEEVGVDVAIGALVDVMVAALKPHRPKKRHEMWLEDLRAPRLLEDVHQKHFGRPWQQGFSERPDPSMTVPVGIVDKPRQHAQEVLAYDLSAVNIGIVGEPGSGRTTTAMTFLTSLAMRYTPQQVQFIGVRLGGPGLSALDRLPHSAGIYGADDPEGLTRAISEIVNLVDSREQSFPQYGIEDVKEWRRRRFGLANGPVPPDGFGEVWLGVDNWQEFALKFERSYEAIKSIMGKCSNYGVHVLWTASSLIGGGMQKSVTDNTKLTLELRIGDESMSDVSRQEAKKVPDDIPGRGLTKEGKKVLHMMYGFPGRRRTAEGDLEVSALVDQIVAIAGTDKHARVRRLPQSVSLQQVREMPSTPDDHKHSIRFGITDTDLGPARLDFTKASTFMAVGAPESGRSNLVRGIAHGIMDNYTSDEAIIHMVDIKRNQLGVVTEESGYLGHYCFTQDQVQVLAFELAEELKARQPEQKSNQKMLMAGAQFTGKRIFVLVDDYNALSASGMALDPLAEFIELAGFVGLHLIIGGQTRDFYRWSNTTDLMRKVMGSQTQGVILNASKHDGPLIGDVIGEPQREGRGLFVQPGGKVSATMVAWTEPPTAAG
ncbi:type VII secretion protein EccCa [Mycobacterium sp. D16R24]|uniref:type VII secretion protein EccCa n=1 Tax=Mycobacterium sp. D16R24 TaxID=1855656 RepID=UPI0009943C8B|nr:type VII secretion protein EccCa [Mycobacterium sp. D16R24]